MVCQACRWRRFLVMFCLPEASDIIGDGPEPYGATLDRNDETRTSSSTDTDMSQGNNIRRELFETASGRNIEERRKKSSLSTRTPRLF